jgi:hypothetical protein
MPHFCYGMDRALLLIAMADTYALLASPQRAWWAATVGDGGRELFNVTGIRYSPSKFERAVIAIRMLAVATAA